MYRTATFTLTTCHFFHICYNGKWNSFQFPSDCRKSWFEWKCGPVGCWIQFAMHGWYELRCVSIKVAYGVGVHPRMDALIAPLQVTRWCLLQLLAIEIAHKASYRLVKSAVSVVLVSQAFFCGLQLLLFRGNHWSLEWRLENRPMLNIAWVSYTSLILGENTQEVLCLGFGAEMPSPSHKSA